MKTLVFDIETDHLNASVLWCIVAIDDDDKVHSFYGDKLEEGLAFLNTADRLVGHNILGFDIPVLKKLYGWQPKKSIEDSRGELTNLITVPHWSMVSAGF